MRWICQICREKLSHENVSLLAEKIEKHGHDHIKQAQLITEELDLSHRDRLWLESIGIRLW